MSLQLIVISFELKLAENREYCRKTEKKTGFFEFFIIFRFLQNFGIFHAENGRRQDFLLVFAWILNKICGKYLKIEKNWGKMVKIRLKKLRRESVPMWRVRDS